jgi:hypothetical protein
MQFLGYGHEIPEVPQFHDVKCHSPRAGTFSIAERIQEGFKKARRPSIRGVFDLFPAPSALAERFVAQHPRQLERVVEHGAK